MGASQSEQVVEEEDDDKEEDDNDASNVRELQVEKQIS